MLINRDLGIEQTLELQIVESPLRLVENKKKSEILCLKLIEDYLNLLACYKIKRECFINSNYDRIIEILIKSKM